MQTFKKNLIFTADDFGYDKAFNYAVFKAFKEGMLNSAALMANCEGFDEAVEMFKNMKGCRLSVHLNIIEGNALSTGEPFKDWFFKIWQKTYDKNYMNFLEKEFRVQIEKVLKYHKPDMINSHVHTHAIPKIFELTCKLAKEYGIEYVRTQFEQPYYVKGKVLKLSYPVNMAKVVLLNSFTLKNRKVVEKYGLQTNDYIIGVNYTANMDVDTVQNGLSAIQNKAKTAEILVHPCYYENNLNITSPLPPLLNDERGNADCNVSLLDSRQIQHYKEFQTFMDKNLKQEIEKQGWNLNNID